MAIQPKFSKDLSKMAYISSTEQFISHSGNYELKVMDWETKEVKTVIKQFQTIPEGAEFCGLYGYNMTYL